MSVLRGLVVTVASVPDEDFLAGREALLDTLRMRVDAWLTGGKSLRISIPWHGAQRLRSQPSAIWDPLTRTPHWIQ
jgi:hypothetical protein